jgi:hypothetical protein
MRGEHRDTRSAMRMRRGNGVDKVYRCEHRGSLLQENVVVHLNVIDVTEGRGIRSIGSRRMLCDNPSKP